jgi:hypothetical protein
MSKDKPADKHKKDEQSVESLLKQINGLTEALQRERADSTNLAPSQRKKNQNWRFL